MSIKAVIPDKPEKYKMENPTRFEWLIGEGDQPFGIFLWPNIDRALSKTIETVTPADLHGVAVDDGERPLVQSLFWDQE